jgi:hypothetical protein
MLRKEDPSWWRRSVKESGAVQVRLFTFLGLRQHRSPLANVETEYPGLSIDVGFLS